MSRGHAIWVLAATAVPGMLFAPVFGAAALVAPVAAVLVACYAVAELCLRFAALRPWRPVFALLVGLLALVEVSLFDTTVGGLPTVESGRALLAGVSDSWELTLQSTWPVRPEPELLLFVPLLVLFTAMIGLELLRWPAAAVLPSLALLLVSQAFVAVSGLVATLVGLAYAVLVAGLFFSRVRSAVALTVVLGVAAGALTVVVATPAAYSVRQNQTAHVPLAREVSPLSEIAARLGDPDTEVFRYTSDAPVDRWRLVVLDDFDGVRWTAADQYRRLGSAVEPPAAVTVPTRANSARVTVDGDDPWLPSQGMPASVTGAAPLIDQDTGTLLLTERDGRLSYDLRWWEPSGDLPDLLDAAVSGDVDTGGLGTVPAGITTLAREATRQVRPTFRTAMLLEQYLRDNYQVTTGGTLPTGSGWPQLETFLLKDKAGTSEQFAAAYVVLARIVGIPARLAVGYAAPEASGDGETVVRNGDVLAWPEVAVDGVGWVPLDPLGARGGVGRAPSKLAEVTAQARAALPPPDEDVPDPPVPADDVTEEPGDPVPWGTLVVAVLAGLVALLVLAVLAIPVVKFGRRLARRRLGGVRGVVGAWWEARDLLAAHGARITPGMTARDLASVSEGSIVDSLHRLAFQLDLALWSGAGASDGTVAAAWSAVREIRGALASRSLRARLRAVFAFR
ncbi:transglutaminaseTgpA domain-containing protein [Actinophytocola xinjiangensis]|uniref:transglutaminase family protein n=1 Tax=Actinophytocola xinjiangensis TaxID=485602 RepID=UPI000B1D2D3B|nr:DUF3488 and transglutaminase-like domain-containing protein [Actinophytocola xinjiangensis]